MPILIHGKNPVIEAMKAKRHIHELFILENQDTRLFDGFDLSSIKMTRLTHQKMDVMFPKAHQGVGARVADYATVTLEQALRKEGKKLFVILDSVEDPHNLGAVIRTADAFAVSGVIIPKHRSAHITPTVVKVSTGAVEYVDIIEVTNLNQTVRTLKEHNIWVVGTDINTDKTLEDIHTDTDLAIVFGSEGKGLSRLLKDNCDYIVKIPMQGHVNSLNVSVTCGIVLYDIVRRR